MDHGMIFGVWLGVAVFALGSGNVLLWRANRLFSHSRGDTIIPRASRVPTAAAVSSGVTAPAGRALAS